MPRFIAILSLFTLLGLPLGARCPADDLAVFDIKYRYFVVSIEAPADWVKGHRVTIQWQGKTVPLPVVFRVAGPADGFNMSAGPEQMKYLKIGKEKIPVTCKPDSKFRVGNESVIAFPTEKSIRKDVLAISLVTWAAVSPVEQDSPKNVLTKRLKELLAAGQVIDVQPAR